MPDEWIRQLGDPVLRTAVAGDSRCDGTLRAQLQRMERTLRAADGAGLAAPQVGILARAFVYRMWPDRPVEALVNPRIVARSSETAEFVEGCLSFQSVTVAVSRPAGVSVAGLSIDGHERTVRAEGIEASLLQHEIDHLDGLLTLDRAQPAERRRALGVLAARSRMALV